MLKANKYRLYPTDSQKELLSKHFGCVRFVYNLALETKISAYAGNKVSLSRYDLQAQLTDLKNECGFLKEVNSQSLQSALLNLDIAYGSFFKGRGKFPNFKKKSNKQSFSVPQSVTIEDNRLYIPKFKDGIEIVLHKPINGTIRSATISKTPTGKYFVSILTETGIAIPKKKPIDENTAIGIDLNLKETCVCSDGIRFDNPKHLKKSIERLKILQKRLSKKVKGSNRYKRKQHTIALCHEKVANQRKDFLHKVSYNLVNNHDTLVFETLKIQNMMKNHCLAQSIGDAGWSMLIDFCKYKADWYGKNVLQIGTFDPSTKLCNICGTLNHTLTLADRQWVCANCGTLHDRDNNSAINIKSFGLKNNITGGLRAADAEPPTLVGTMKRQKFDISKCATHIS